MKRANSQTNIPVVFLAALALMSTACGGDFKSNQVRGPALAAGGNGNIPGDQTGPDKVSTVAKFTCSDPAQAGKADKTRRLTKQEVISSLSSILGTSLVNSAAAEANAIPEDSTQNIVREFSANHSMNHMTAMMELGLKLGSAVESNATLKRKFASCWPASGAPTDACIKTFISAFGLQFYRRPLTTDEQTFYFEAYKKFGSTPVRGLLSLMVQAPNFLFQIEEGSSMTDGTRVRLTDYEIASRLSFRLTGTSPDELLYAAAAKGELGTQAGLETQAQRLLASAQGEARIQHFFSEYANLKKVPQVSALLPDLPDSDVTALRQDMISEYQSLISQVVVKGNADFKTLFSTPAVFPKSQRLAAVYGTSVWDGTSAPPVSTQGHRGILMRAALLASGHLETNIILRGVRVRREVLCDTLLSPPPEIIQTRTQETSDYTPDKFSNRQLVEHKTSPTNCMGCHSQINPIGYVLEGYNQFGMRRSQQAHLDSSGRIVASFPVDTRVSNANIEAGNTGSVVDASELIMGIANGSKARACISQRMFEFARLRSFATSDNCSIAAIESSLIAGGSIKDAFYKSVVNSEIFWKNAVQ